MISLIPGGSTGWDQRLADKTGPQQSRKTSFLCRSVHHQSWETIVVCSLFWNKSVTQRTWIFVLRNLSSPENSIEPHPVSMQPGKRAAPKSNTCTKWDLLHLHLHHAPLSPVFIIVRGTHHFVTFTYKVELLLGSKSAHCYCTNLYLRQTFVNLEGSPPLSPCLAHTSGILIRIFGETCSSPARRVQCVSVVKDSTRQLGAKAPTPT